MYADRDSPRECPPYPGSGSLNSTVGKYRNIAIGPSAGGHRGVNNRFMPFRGRGGGRGGHHYNQQPRFNRHGSGSGQYTDQQQQKMGDNHSPWMTAEILKMIEEKDQMWAMYEGNRSEDNYRNFKIKRIQVNMAVNDAKFLFHQKNHNGRENGQVQYSQVFKRNNNSSNLQFQQPQQNTRQLDRGFNCDPCDKSFSSQELLDEHKNEHITCKLDGCTYTAHVKLVMKHIELQHSTNLFNRIKGFDTPEDIEKWKEERRKNFPTPANIQRKKAEIAERKSRGEMLSAKEDFPGIENFRYKIIREEERNRMNRKRHYGANGYQSDGYDEANPRPGKLSLLRYNKNPAIRMINFYTDVVVEKGTEKLIGSTRENWMTCDDSAECDENTRNEQCDSGADAEFSITDDEYEVDSTLNNQTLSGGVEIHTTSGSNRPIGNGNGSSGLLGIAGYGSASETEEDGELKVDKSDIKKTVAIHPGLLPDKGEVGNNSDNEAPDEIPATISKKDSSVTHNSISSLSTTAAETKRGHSTKNIKKNFNKPQESLRNKQATKIRRKYTLLQRLLAPDIRKEKNILLQACRFIVDNNFLDG